MVAAPMLAVCMGYCSQRRRARIVCRTRGGTPRRRRAQVALHRSPSSRPAQADVESRGVTEWQAQINAPIPYGVEHSRKSQIKGDAYQRSMGSVSNASGQMDPDLALIACSALCRPGARVMPPARKFAREFGKSAFAVLRYETQSCRTMCCAMLLGLTPQNTCDAEVSNFLKSSWNKIASAVALRRGPQLEYMQRAARWFGRFLRGTPEDEVRNTFETVLSSWAKPAKSCASTGEDSGSNAILEEVTISLVCAEDLSHEELMDNARCALRIIRGAANKWNLEPRAVAEAVALVSEAVPKFAEESVHVFRNYLLHHNETGVDSGGVWASLEGTSPQLRIAFLDALISNRIDNNLQFGGIHIEALGEVCADFVLDTSFPYNADTEGQVMRVLRHAADLCDGFVRCELAPSKALVLVRAFGAHIGQAAPTLLSTLVQDMLLNPSLYTEEDIFVTAQTLDGATSVRNLESLGQVLLNIWSQMEPEMLMSRMLDMPSVLAVLPTGFQRALTQQCNGRSNVLVSLAPNFLTALIIAWASLPNEVPEPLRLLLKVAVDKDLTSLDAQALVKASCILDDDHPTAAADIVLWWHRWLADTVECCRVTGWGRCCEALREVVQWRDAALLNSDARSASLADLVLEGVMMQQLSDLAPGAPLELLLQLCNIGADKTSNAERIASALEERVWQCLRGTAGKLPLVTAVSVANGETPVKCTPNTRMWDAVVMSLASQISSPQELHLFCSCRPRRDLWVAVAQHTGGWCALELHMRLAA